MFGLSAAEKFVKQVVVDTLDPKNNGVCIMYPSKWPQMLDAAWREKTIAMLKRHRVHNPSFCPPDEYDGWTFSAYKGEK